MLNDLDVKPFFVPLLICLVGLVLGFLMTGMGVGSFLFILAPALIILIAYRLIYGVYLLIFSLPYFGVLTYEWFGVTLKISDFIALAFIFVFLVKFALKPKETFSPSRVMMPVGIFVFFSVIIFLIHYPEVAELTREGGLNSPALRSIKVTLWTVYSGLVAVMVSSAIKTPQMLKNCVKLLLFSTVIVSLYSLVGLAGYLFGIKALTWKLVGTPGGFVRLRGTFGEPSYFAHYMALVLPLAITTFMFKIYRFGFWGPPITMFILFFTQVLIFSTTGMVGLSIMLLLIPIVIRLYGLLTFRERMRYTLIFMVIGVAFLLFWMAFNPDLLNVSVKTLAKLFVPEARYSGLLLGIKLLRENYITGVGPGNWEWFGQKYIDEVHAATGFMPSFNNLYLEILLDTGIVGFIPFAFIFIILFKEISKAMRSTDDKFLQAVLAGFLVGFVVLLFEYTASFNFYRIYTWVPLGMAIAAARLARQEKDV